MGDYNMGKPFYMTTVFGGSYIVSGKSYAECFANSLKVLESDGYHVVGCGMKSDYLLSSPTVSGSEFASEDDDEDESNLTEFCDIDCLDEEDVTYDNLCRIAIMFDGSVPTDLIKYSEVNATDLGKKFYNDRGCKLFEAYDPIVLKDMDSYDGCVEKDGLLYRSLQDWYNLHSGDNSGVSFEFRTATSGFVGIYTRKIGGYDKIGFMLCPLMQMPVQGVDDGGDRRRFGGGCNFVMIKAADLSAFGLDV